jgi:hypothetical protein
MTVTTSAAAIIRRATGLRDFGQKAHRKEV